jgi:hypothetical protein
MQIRPPSAVQFNQNAVPVKPELLEHSPERNRLVQGKTFPGEREELARPQAGPQRPNLVELRSKTESKGTGAAQAPIAQPSRVSDKTLNTGKDSVATLYLAC